MTKKGAILLIFLAIIPALYPQEFFWVQLVQLGIYALALYGLNLLVGYTGQISLCHGAFMSIGAFASGIWYQYFPSPFFDIFMGGVTTGVIGLFVALPVLRIHGNILSLTTLCLAVVYPNIVNSRLLDPWTHGLTGLKVPILHTPFSLAISDYLFQYYVVLIGGGLIIFGFENILRRSHWGLSFDLIRSSEEMAQTFGMNVGLFKISAFIFSATIAGIAGGFFIFHIGTIAATDFGLFVSLGFLSAVVVGGLHSALGSLLAGLYFGLQNELASVIIDQIPSAQNLRWALNGLILILFVKFFPKGLEPIVRRLVSR